VWYLLLLEGVCSFLGLLQVDEGGLSGDVLDGVVLGGGVLGGDVLSGVAVMSGACCLVLSGIVLFRHVRVLDESDMVP